MYNHILLPVELGGPGDVALAHQAAQALIDPDGKISLLHVVEPVPSYVETYVPVDFGNQTLAGARARLEEIGAVLGVRDTAVKLGSTGRCIVDWATENAADCIVIASHKPGFSDVVLGSTAAWVVRHTPTAIHIVR